MITTNGRIVLSDLADLGRFLDEFVLDTDSPPPDSADDGAPSAAPPSDATPPDEPVWSDPPWAPAPSLLPVPVAPVRVDEVATLATTLATALADLEAVVEAEAHARRQAAAALTVYHDLGEARARLADLIAAAEVAATRARELAANALAVDGRERATRVATMAEQLAATALARLAAAREQAERLAARPDVARLLAEEAQHAAEVERAADVAMRARQLQDGLEQARSLLAEGNENEADGLLGALTKDHPNNPDIASLMHTLDRRARAVKTRTAEQTLRQARRLARHTPAEAVALLGPLDLDGLPDDLARQVYGCWLAACRRTSPAGARHYSPRFGHGAVLVPTTIGQLTVVAAIGLPEWTAGRSFAAAALRGAQPL